MKVGAQMQQPEVTKAAVAAPIVSSASKTSASNTKAIVPKNSGRAKPSTEGEYQVRASL